LYNKSRKNKGCSVLQKKTMRYKIRYVEDVDPIRAEVPRRHSTLCSVFLQSRLGFHFRTFSSTAICLQEILANVDESACVEKDLLSDQVCGEFLFFCHHKLGKVILPSLLLILVEA